MISIQIPEKQLEDIDFYRFNHPSPIVQKRMHILYMKFLNINHSLIALILNIHINTVTGILKLYNSEGIEGLVNLKYRKNISELDNHVESIEKDFKDNPPMTVKEAMNRIEAITGIKRSLTQVRKFMKRIGMKFRKMGHIPGKADPVEQENYYKKNIQPLIESAIKGSIALYFVDAAHFTHVPYMGFVWCFERVFMKSPSGRKRFNVLGALNAISKKVVTVTNETYVDSSTIKDLLYKLRKTHPNNIPIHLLLDNARYQKCKYVFDIAEELNIVLEYLPAYSPNLNIIERLWKFIKKKVLYCKYYENFPEFKEAIEGCFQKIKYSKEYKMELSSLLRLKFQFFKIT